MPINPISVTNPISYSNFLYDLGIRSFTINVSKLPAANPIHRDKYSFERAFAKKNNLEII